MSGAERPVVGWHAATGARPGCPARFHDTEAAYNKHGCRCRDARDAHYLYDKRRKLGRARPKLVPNFGVRRRLRALQAAGWPVRALAAELGCSYGRVSHMAGGLYGTVHRDTAAAVAALYDRLSMVPGPSLEAARRAAAAGWYPPLAWDDEDLDDPAARPRDTWRDSDVAWPGIDWTAVERAAAGHPPPRLTDAEQVAAIRFLAGRGCSDQDIADTLRVDSRKYVERIRRARGIPSGRESVGREESWKAVARPHRRRRAGTGEVA
jgi:hypothetical protein